MFDLSHRFRSFRAHHKYNYPGLFICLALGKAVVEFSVVVACVWFVLPFMLGNHARTDVTDSQSSFRQVSTATQELPVVTDNPGVRAVEVLAGSTPEVYLLNSTPALPLPALSESQAGMRNTDWLMNRDDGKYVIQLGSSIDKRILYKRAFEISRQYPVVVFPFGKNKRNQTVYGFSAGVFDSFAAAREAAGELPVTADGIWIRSADELKAKVSAHRS